VANFSLGARCLPLLKLLGEFLKGVPTLGGLPLGVSLAFVGACVPLGFAKYGGLTPNFPLAQRI